MKNTFPYGPSKVQNLFRIYPLFLKTSAFLLIPIFLVTQTLWGYEPLPGEPGYQPSTSSYDPSVPVTLDPQLIDTLDFLQGGSPLTSATPDEDELMLEDGTVLRYIDGKLRAEIFLTGEALLFDEEGRVIRHVAADGIKTEYERTGAMNISRFDANGNELEIVVDPGIPALPGNEAIQMSFENGLKGYYQAGELIELRFETGIRIREFVVDEEGNPKSALMIYPDKTRDILREGQLIRRILPDGSILDYSPSGQLIREMHADGSTTDYLYAKRSQTEMISTKLLHSDGSYVLYDHLGILRKVLGADGKYFEYDRETFGEGYRLVLNRSVSAAVDEKTMTESYYDAAANLTGMLLEDGTQIFYENGRLDRVLDADGEEIDYSYAEDLGFVRGLNVQRGDSEFVYDESGFLQEIVTENGKVIRQASDTNGDGSITDDDVIDILLETVGGDRLLDFELDADGNILNGILETKEGIKQTIENGVLTGFETVDGKIYSVVNQQATLQEWHFRDGTRILYGGGTIDEVLFPNGSRLHSIGFDADKKPAAYIEAWEDGTERHFVEQRLTKLVLADGSELHYGKTGRAEKVVIPDGSERAIQYQKNEAGEIEEISFKTLTGDNQLVPEEKIFRPDGVLLRVLTNGAYAEVENNEISKLFTRFGVVDVPELDADGSLSGEIRFEDGAVLKVEGGKLRQAIRSNGTKVNFSLGGAVGAGRIESIEMTDGALYSVLYDEDPEGNVQDMRIRLDNQDGAPEFPLVPFLQNPERLIQHAQGEPVPDHPITFHGNAQIADAAPKHGTGNVAFDGAGDYVSLEHDPSFEFGTGDWTVDFWVKFNQQTSEYSLFRKGDHLNGGIQINRHAGINRWDIFIGGDRILSFNSSLTTGAWHHVALIREGDQLKFYQDGVFLNAIAAGASNITNQEMISIGSNRGAYHFLPGEMDDIRVSRGARWTSGFTPPSDSVVTDENTVLLLNFEPPAPENPEMQVNAAELSEILMPRSLFNSLEDASRVQSIFRTKQSAAGGAHAFELYGNPALETANPKMGDSALRTDGSDDSLKIEHDESFEFGTDDWTVDFWVQFDQQSSEYSIMRMGDHLNGGIQINRHAGRNRWDVFIGGDRIISVYSSITTGQWHHVALLREGGLLKLYQDGLLIGEVSAGNSNINTTDALYLGSNQRQYHYFPGKIDEFRMSKGIARWTGNFIPPAEEATHDEQTSLLLHFTEEEKNASSEIIPPDPNAGDPSANDQQLFFAKLVLDMERGQSFEFAKDYFPEWLNISLDQNSVGFVERSIQKGASDNAADLTAALFDLDGDGRKDRVMSPAGTDYWWVERNNGQGFDERVQWTGVNTSISSYTLRETSGPHPIFTSDLIDMNGDGRPDRILSDYNDPMWKIQLNNGSGFDPVQDWGEAHVLSFFTPEGKYAIETRFDLDGGDIQDLQSALVDMDGDGLPDRIIRPVLPEGQDPADHWFFQKNTGSGFAAAVIWEGVDWTFYPHSAGFYSGDSQAIGASISWHHAMAGTYDMFADIADLVDMNGDQMPDRILLKHRNESDSLSTMDWYVQFNNGSGFDEAVLWDEDVRALPGAPNAAFATSIQLIDQISTARNYLIDLADVTGDGLPDRITINTDGTGAQKSWWVEVNNGMTFLPAVEWSGIHGDTALETSLGQDNRLYRMNRGTDVSCARVMPCHFEKSVDLTDLNGDGFLDRVLYRTGESRWIVQFGTGAGFLPAEEMKIVGLEAESQQIYSSRYDYLHVSIKSAAPITAEMGKVRLSLGNPDEPDTYQEWVVEGLQKEWQNFYLPLDPTKGNAADVRVEFEPAGEDPNIAIYVDNMTFTSVNPPAVDDWMDRLLTEAPVLSEIYSERTQTLANYLGFTEASADVSLNWEQLLNAETRITFDEAGEASEFETLYGTVTEVADGHVTQSVLPDGTIIHFEAPAAGSFNVTQTVVTANGTETVQSAYGRVRSITREGASALQYSYEFEADGKEVTVVFDPDSGTTERYKNDRLISRTAANGLVTSFEYDEQGEVSKTAISYKGRVRQTFHHRTTEAGTRIITTEDGVEEEYNGNGEILFHTTPAGYQYKHEFQSSQKVVSSFITETIELPDGTSVEVTVPTTTLEPDPEGEEVHTVTLTGYQSEGGDYAEYEGGTLKSLKLADGTRISFDELSIREVQDLDTGTVTVERNPLNVTVFHSDGTITEYRNSQPFSLTSATGKVLNISKDNGGFVANTESAKFHHAQAAQAWNETILSHWQSFQAPAGLAVKEEYDATGQFVMRESVEGTIELYNENGKIYELLSPKGERLIRYEYDSDDNPVLISYEGFRRNLYSTELKLRAQIAMKQEHALAYLAEREQVIDETVEGEYRTIRDNVLRIRTDLENRYSAAAALPVDDKKGKAQLSNILAQIQGGIDKVNAALEQLANQRAEALENLAAQVLDANSQIATQTSESYQQLDTEILKVKHAILRQELAPVIYHWHRHILGRDPTQAEYDSWINPADYDTQVFDLEELKDALLTGEEYASRSTEVQAIKAAVETKLNNYKALSNEDKIAFAETLGIPLDKVISLSESEIDLILGWLQGQSLHFGQSAFISLEAMLSDAGISFAREEIATSLILMDILTGVITPAESGDLLISVYAMKKLAARYGLQVEAVASHYAGLKALYDAECPDPQNCGFRMVAHINGNHFVIITKVTEDEVTYMDPGIGAEGANEVMTLTKDEFLEAWINSGLKNTGLGTLITPRAPPAEILLSEVSADLPSVRMLNDDEQMSVRGAFFGFLKKIFKIINNFLLFTLNPVLFVLAQVETYLKRFIDNLAASMAHSVLFATELITFDFDSAWDHFKQSLSTLMTAAMVAVDITVDLLMKVGVSEEVALTIIDGVKIVVGVILAFTPAVAIGVALVVSGISGIVNRYVEMSPTVSLIVNSAIAVVGAVVGGLGSFESIADALKTVAITAVKEFAAAGVVAVGNAIGLDPRVTGLISTGVRAGIGMAGNRLMNGGVHSTQPEGTLVGYRDGDLSPIYVSYPADWGDFIGDAIQNGTKNISASFGSTESSSGSGFMDGRYSPKDIDDSIMNEPGLFDKIFGTLKDAAISAKNYLGPVAIAATPSIILNFNQAQLSNGLSQTLNEHVNVVFDRPTIENIFNTPGGIDTILAQGTTPMMLPDGATGNAYHFSDTTDLIFDDSGNFVGQFKNGSYEIGDFTVSDREFVLNTGTRYTDFGNGVRTEMIFQDGQIQQISMYENAIDPKFVIESINEEPIFIKGPDGNLELGGDFEMSIDNLIYVVINGKVSSAKVKTGDGQGSSSGTSGSEDELLYLLVNGINNSETVPDVYHPGKEVPNYYSELRKDLHELDANIDQQNDVAIASVFGALKLPDFLDGTQKFINRLKDILLLQAEANVPLAPLQLVGSIVSQVGIQNADRPLYGLGYSGGFAPMLEAMNVLGMETQMIAGVGAATINIVQLRDVLNLLVKSIFALNDERILNQNGNNFVQRAKDIISAVYDHTIGLIPVIGDLFKDVLIALFGDISKTIDWVEKAAEFMIDVVGKLFEFLRVQWLLSAQPLIGLSQVGGADGVLNIYGDRDFLVDLGIAGKMSNIAGFSGQDVLDIEIKSYTNSAGVEANADHYIYMRDIRDYNDIDDPAKRILQEQFDLKVAAFVAQLLVAGTTKDNAKAFLEGFPGIVLNADGSYEFYPFGGPS